MRSDVVWRWELFCDGDYVYSTTDEAAALSWVEVDPQGHEARRQSQAPDDDAREGR